MGRVCCIKSCKSNSSKTKGLHFFSIPSVITNQCDKTKTLSFERRRKWLKIVGLTEATLKFHNRVCSKHFITGHASKLFENTHPDWLPNVNIDNEPSSSQSCDVNCGNAAEKILRYDRRLKRAKQGLSYPSTVESKVPKCDLPNLNALENERSLSPENIVIKVEPPDFFDDVIENSEVGDEVNPNNFFEESELVTSDNTIIKNERINQSIFLNHDGEIIDANLDFTVVGNFDVQVPKLLIDGSTQTENSGNGIIENTGSLKPVETQSSVTNVVDNSTQTSFRVCYKFELEAAYLEIAELKSKIKELNQNMVEAYSEILTLREETSQN